MQVHAVAAAGAGRNATLVLACALHREPTGHHGGSSNQATHLSAVQQEVQLLQVRLEGVGMQQQGLARLADTHSHLHQCSHTRLCELEESQEQHKAMLAEHSSQLTDLQAIWEREQRKHNPGHASCGEGESGAGQPGEALPGRKRARQEGGSQQAAAAGLSGGLVSQPAVGSAAGGWAAMEKEDMAASAW